MRLEKWREMSRKKLWKGGDEDDENGEKIEKGSETHGIFLLSFSVKEKLVL